MESRHLVRWYSLNLLVLGLLGPSCASREPADLILYGGQVLTVDEAFTI